MWLKRASAQHGQNPSFNTESQFFHNMLGIIGSHSQNNVLQLANCLKPLEVNTNHPHSEARQWLHHALSPSSRTASLNMHPELQASGWDQCKLISYRGLVKVQTWNHLRVCGNWQLILLAVLQWPGQSLSCLTKKSQEKTITLNMLRI